MARSVWLNSCLNEIEVKYVRRNARHLLETQTHQVITARLLF